MPEDVRHATDASESTGSTRRSVLSTAAWSVPAIAISASAPLASASTPATSCPSNVTAIGMGNYSTRATVSRGLGHLSFYGSTFGINLSGLRQGEYGRVATALPVSGALVTTARDGAATSHSAFLSGSAELLIGQSTAMPHMNIGFHNIAFPNGVYNPDDSPVRLTSVTLTVALTFTPPGGATLECPSTFTWILGSGGGHAGIGMGQGVIPFSGTTTAA